MLKKLLKLSLIGIIGGLVLMLVLKIVIMLTGNSAYLLLFNFDYIPVLNELRPVELFGYVFHFLTCIFSVIGLYYILKNWNIERQLLPYILVYTMGGGALFFLTSLSDQPPAANDVVAWIYWTMAHGIFGYVIGAMVKKWV